MMLRDILGKNVRYHRAQRKLTQEQAAELCNMSSKYWGKIERGDQAATIDIIAKISAGLNIPAEDLLAEQKTDRDNSPNP